jgi:hypothetical protein
MRQWFAALNAELKAHQRAIEDIRVQRLSLLADEAARNSQTSRVRLS